MRKTVLYIFSFVILIIGQVAFGLMTLRTENDWLDFTYLIIATLLLCVPALKFWYNWLKKLFKVEIKELNDSKA